MKHFKIHSLIRLLVITFPFVSIHAQKNNNKSTPNVILIVADDLAYGDLSYVNGGKTKTPHLDELARSGKWFENAYSASAVCAPARAALLTGKFPHETGCVTLNMTRYPELTSIDTSMATIADYYLANGYKTGLIGKWHNGNRPEHHPMNRGFTEFQGFLGFMVENYNSYQLDINGEIKAFQSTYLTNELTNRAIDFVRRHRDNPFFLHLAHYAPHRPLGAPEKIVKYFLDKGYSRKQATIYAMIEVMDKGIGELVGELKSLGIIDNTLILFTSDNGPDPLTGNRPNAGLKGTKYTINEGGIRIPFIAYWKGSIDPGIEKRLIHFTDVVPSLVEICDLQIAPTTFSGGSFAGLLNEQYTSKLPELRYWQWNRGAPNYSHNATLRDGKWKLIRPFVTRNEPLKDSDASLELYDVENDPSEENDLSSQNEKRVLIMNTKLEEWSRQVEFKRRLNQRNK